VDALDIIGWSFVAAVTAWGMTLSWAKLVLARSRTVMEEEIHYWRAEAVSARELTAQLKHEIATWTRGCQQGREDVIAIMPLLIATQERLSGTRLTEMALAEMTEV
jgi:hypothetical protein